jgi:uroporphyrinogen-III synthase
VSFSAFGILHSEFQPVPSLLLTRSAEDNARTAPIFERRGFTVYSVPMIELRPIAKDACGTRQVRRLAGGEPVLLTSAFATELWLDLRETDFHEHAPAGYYVVGESSAELLREGDPDVPIRAVARSAEELLRDGFEGVGRLLYPCSTERRDTLVDGLRERGVDVVDMPLYSPALPAASRELLPRILTTVAGPLVIAFFSPSAVEGFFRLSPDFPPTAIFAAIGATTAAALHARGIEHVLQPDEPNAEAMAERLTFY